MKPLLTAFSLLIGFALFAGQVQFEWDAINLPEVAGYRLQVGTNSGGTTTNIDLPGRLTNSYTLTIPAGKWYARIAGISTNGAIGDLSNELTFDVPRATQLRIRLQTSASIGGPWTDRTNVLATELASDTSRYFRLQIDPH